MEILSAESTELFIGTEQQPAQVIRVRVRGTEGDDLSHLAQVSVRGERVSTDHPVALDPLPPGELRTVEVGVTVEGTPAPGTTFAAEAVVELDDVIARLPLVVTVAEPGWRMFMVSHFHYDPVWWNTQAAYTETWGTERQFRALFQEPGLALVKAHLEMARRDADYKFVLAELDYLKPYWGVYPEDRDYFRQLLAEGRLELMGGTYNEPNTNLTSAESTIRNAIYGVGYQRDVLGGSPQTAWQLDAFGHDPQFPGIMADAGITSSSWARGPFHEWGPHWVRGPEVLRTVMSHRGEAPGMQFHSEFDWIAPSGRALLTSFMPNHYSAGWWMDACTSLEQAEVEAFRLFTEIKAEATTRNVLLPVGTDYSPPNKWVTAIHRDWAARYVWPRFETAIARDFFDAVRAERATTGRGFSPQSRDMNPVYTGKDVSFIDTKQAQRNAENTLIAAEKFGTIASLLGARYPSEAIDKAWRHLLFGAHHDGITGSESDQVYLDLVGGWREAQELGGAALNGALSHLGSRIDTSGEGQAITVFNPLSWTRSDIGRVEISLPPRTTGLELRDEGGTAVPFVTEAIERAPDGSLGRLNLAFLAADVPGTGYRTFRAIPAAELPPGSSWRQASGATMANEAWAIEVDPTHGAITRLEDRRTGKQVLRPGETGNELRCYGEYPMHPHFGEGPWHLTPDGTRWSSHDYPAEVALEESAIGRRIVVAGAFRESRRTQQITLWDGLDRVDFATRLDDYAGQDRLFRVRFGAAVDGGMPISETGNAVIGRGFGFPNADVAEARFTLDNPAYNWFGLGATARIELADSASAAGPRASRAISIAEVVVPGVADQDAAVRGLVVALAQQGVTATLGRHDRKRYGTLDVDSNMPDVRISVGRPSESRFTAGVLRAAGAAYGDELERQLSSRGWARLWVPAAKPLADTWAATADVRGYGELPCLIVAGSDLRATISALKALVEDLADAVISVEQPARLDGSTGAVEDYTVAILNRGVPSFNVESDGSMYLSVMRSCSGWPSGVWINPPRRTAPDGSNFQFQHWSHTFDYALIGSPGDWRAGRAVQAGHEFNNPLLVRVLDAHSGDLPASTSFASVEPSTAVMTVLKPAGDPLARMAAPDVDAAAGVTMRLYESSGAATKARVSFFAPLRDAAASDVLEATSQPLAAIDGGFAADLGPYAIATLTAVPQLNARAPGAPSASGVDTDAVELASRIEPAQPVFSDYWMHNKGPAPIGYAPVAVQIAPGRVAGTGPFHLPISVASERTDVPAAGTVSLLVPDGWTAEPGERIFRLAPGAHLAFAASVAPAPSAPAGRYFVAARVAEESRQVYEDVVTIDFDPAAANGEDADASVRSPSLSLAIERAMRLTGLHTGNADPAPAAELGGELEAELSATELVIEPGRPAELRVRLRNTVAGEIRGEAQIISPHETWPLITPWTQGFSVTAGGETTVAFSIVSPLGFHGGDYWALVKLMYFGRLLYTESVRIEVRPG
jgi:alpha-mannosidase